jgi:hypothetical protein
MDSLKQEAIREKVPMIQFFSFEKFFCSHYRLNYIRMDVSLDRIDGHKILKKG